MSNPSAHVPGRHILVVEDDAGFRQMIARMLTKEGYTVSEADGLEPALAVVERTPSLDLLLTDIGMAPHTPQGISIARMSQHRNVRLKVVYMTASDAAAIAQYTDGATVLQKPFTPQILLKALAETLAAPLRR